MGDHVVQLAGDPRPLLQQRAPGAFRLADGLLLGEPALGDAPLPYRRADHQHHGPAHGQDQPAAVAAVRADQMEDQARRAGRQPDSDEGAPGLAQGQREQQEEVGDERRGRPRPHVVLLGRPHQDGQRAHHIGREDDPPGTQRPVRQHQQRHRLHRGEHGRAAAGHAVLVAEVDEGDRQDEHGQGDGGGERQVPGGAGGAHGRGARYRLGHGRDGRYSSARSCAFFALNSSSVTRPARCSSPR